MIPRLAKAKGRRIFQATFISWSTRTLASVHRSQIISDEEEMALHLARFPA